MKLRLVSLALIGALIAGFAVAPLSASAQTTPSNGPYTVPQSPVFDSTGRQVGTFRGGVRNLGFVEGPNNTLRVSGVLNGTVTRNNGTTQTVRQVFDNVVAVVGVTRVCDILRLNIGRINLDLLGLIVDIAPININITAQSGPGNLLGNLLCAIVNLLNP